MFIHSRSSAVFMFLKKQSNLVVMVFFFLTQKQKEKCLKKKIEIENKSQE